MTQQDNDGAPAVKQAALARRRVVNLAAQLVGSAGLAFGAISTLARRRHKDKEANGKADDDRDVRREERRAASKENTEGDDKADKQEARLERRESRQETNGGDDNARGDSADNAQRASRQSNNNNNNRNNNNDDTDDEDDDGNNRGNAGSGFFDSPLARKAKRRSNDFDNDRDRDRDDEPRDEPLTGERDEDGQQTFETNNISFSNGPDGLEVVTGNIEYSAPPTPTPTPFPTLTLPERDRLDVFGDRVIATPTPAPSDGGTSSGTVPPPADSGTNTGTSGSTGSRPTPTPSTGDTSGGDNTSDFLS